MPLRQIETPRLRLRCADPALAGSVLDFYRRNREHFARWDPPRPADFLSLPRQRAHLDEGAAAFREGHAWGYWLTLNDDPVHPPRIVGQCRLSNVVRGVFHSANLGYAIDHAHEGRGLMFEALGALVEAVFARDVNLHRIQAATRPENVRSARVLQRLGFTPIGLAPQYLYIDGDWRDHQLWQLINRGFVWPAAG